MALDYDQTTAAVRLDQKQALITAVYRAGAADEVGWLEWKSHLDLTERRSFFTIAKAVLGFANRMPNRALRSAEGHGYLLVGVEPGQARGIEEIDSVELYRKLEAYLGSDIGRLCQPTVVPVDLGNGLVNVLLVDVEPPQWGDPIHVLRKGYHDVAAAAVFVRCDGRTERATPEDMDNLSERARRAPQQVRLSTTVLSGVPLQPVDQGPKARQSWLALETARCHASLHSPTPPADVADRAGTSSGSAAIADILAQVRQNSLGLNRDPRSRDQYLRDVTHHVEQCEKEMPRAVRRAAAIRLSPLALRVTNLTDLNLADAEIQLYIPGAVEAVHPRTQTANESLTGFPSPPKPFGTPTSALFPFQTSIPQDLIPGGLIGRAPAYAPFRPDIANGGSTTITFPLGHIRPRRHADSEDIVVIVSAPAPSPITATWSVTCSNHDTVITGSLELTVADAPVSLTDLFEEVPRGDRQ
ncbi:helix-turn-helix domain-containing protein [Streptomyces sp. NPDC090025]|uniref:AlbA family DNA-binding domain-containing protein n=1 Tax=Streptomyces sp. NPDC090025 TaxID=3365922 RepID=UPI003839B897